MNYSAEICAVVLRDGPLLIGAIEDQIGLSEKTCGLLLGQLCGQGVLKRDRDYISVSNEQRAKLIAEQAKLIAVPVNNNAAKMAAISPQLAAKQPRKIPLLNVPATLEIIKGIPLPPPRLGHSARPILWPFGKMEINDSFAVDVPEGETPQAVADALRRDATAFQRIQQDFRAAVRIEIGNKTVRLWRVAVEATIKRKPRKGKEKT